MLKLFLDYLKLTRNLRLSRNKIKKLQFEKLKRTIKYAYLNVPFYRKKFDDAGIKPSDIKSLNDIAKIPKTTKEELRKAGLEILARGYSAGNCKSSTTSGSTGMPFTSYFDNRSWNMLKYASKLRARKACGLRFGDKIVNIECCVKKIKKRNRGNFLRDSVFKVRYLSISDTLDSHIKFYNRFRPDALYGFASYFLNLAEHIKDNKLKCLKPRMIFTSGEMLDLNTKKQLLKHYGLVFDIYGCTELKEVAWECPMHEGYHVNEDLYFLELVDVANGKNSVQEKEIVTTSLENKAMPLIRYAPGDRGEEINKSCSCGIPFSLIMPTQGRHADCFILPDGRTILPYVLTMALEPIKGILQYQIIQHKKDSVEVKFRPSDIDTKKIAGRIREEMSKVIGKNISIKSVCCSAIPREKNGKYRVVKSYVKR